MYVLLLFLLGRASSILFNHNGVEYGAWTLVDCYSSVTSCTTAR